MGNSWIKIVKLIWTLCLFAFVCKQMKQLLSWLDPETLWSWWWPGLGLSSLVYSNISAPLWSWLLQPQPFWDKGPWHLVKSFMFPTGWSVTTLASGGFAEAVNTAYAQSASKSDLSLKPDLKVQITSDFCVRTSSASSARDAVWTTYASATTYADDAASPHVRMHNGSTSSRSSSNHAVKSGVITHRLSSSALSSCCSAAPMRSSESGFDILTQNTLWNPLWAARTSADASTEIWFESHFRPTPKFGLALI